MGKVGNFDWITEYDEIEKYLQNSFTGLDWIEKDKIRVLVTGCGTSKLSIQLADSGFKDIVSVDNDSECINHMMEMHRDDDRLKWFTYDMVEPESLLQTEEFLEKDLGKFEMIVDKGTFDAILVEGAIYTMLHEVHRLLKVGGVYIVFSLNTEALLAPLLGTDALGFEIACYKILKKCSSNGNLVHEIQEIDDHGNSINPAVSEQQQQEFVMGTVVICKKKSDYVVDMKKLAEEEITVMDNYFKNELPFLTKEQEFKIRNNFELHFCSSSSVRIESSSIDNCNQSSIADINSSKSLTLSEAYNAMFEEEESLEYSYDLFQEDITTFQLRNQGHMTVDEAISFLQMMQ